MKISDGYHASLLFGVICYAEIVTRMLSPQLTQNAELRLVVHLFDCLLVLNIISAKVTGVIGTYSLCLSILFPSKCHNPYRKVHD